MCNIHVAMSNVLSLVIPRMSSKRKFAGKTIRFTSFAGVVWLSNTGMSCNISSKCAVETSSVRAISFQVG